MTRWHWHLPWPIGEKLEATITKHNHRIDEHYPQHTHTTSDLGSVCLWAEVEGGEMGAG